MRTLLCLLPLLVLACSSANTSRPGTPLQEPAPDEPAAPSTDEPAASTEAPADATTEATDTEVDPPSPDPEPTGREYVACGCGCCGSGPTEHTCVSEEELQQIIDADGHARENPQCAVMGCSLGTRYRVCE